MSAARNIIRMFCATFAILFESMSPAPAQVITFDFVGAITSVSGTPFGLDPSIGDTVRGSFSYDSSLPPAYDTGAVAGYIQPPPSGMSVVISGVTLQSDDYNSFQVINNYYGIDNLNGYFTPIFVDGVSQSSSISFNLTDNSQTALSSTALPISLDATRFGQRTGNAYDVASGGFLNFSIVWFAGTPGLSNCRGQSVAALAQDYGVLYDVAKALGYPSVRALQNAIRTYCGG